MVLAVVVLLTSIFAWYQESSSAAIMEGFKKFLVRSRARVMLECVERFVGRRRVTSLPRDS